MGSEIRYYLSIFLRRIHYFALVAIAVAVAGMAVAVVLPTKYQADALLLVESPQISEDLAASTVQAKTAEILQVIQQRLMTRANLLEIADEYDVFGPNPSLYSDEIVETMRRRTRFQINAGRDRASLMSISFEAENAETTAAVVNEYITRVLAENQSLRTGRAEDTMDFFRQEVERLAADLSAQSTKILEFKNAHVNALPENLDYQMKRLDTLRDRDNEITRQLDDIAKQRERMMLVENATGGDRDNQSAEQRQLDRLQDELSNARAVFSENNPKIRLLRTRIATLKDLVAEQEANREAPELTMFDIQMRDLDERAARLREEAETIAPQIERLEANVAATPTNAIELGSLEREYRNTQGQYNQAVTRMATAATGERIELLSKGERISVINQPVVPREPASPDRPMIAMAGVAGGLGLGLAVVVLLELINRSIRRPADLSRGLGIQPIATLPLMRTPGEKGRRRAIVLTAITLVSAVIAGAIFAVHTFVAPIDFLAQQALDALGF